MPDSYPIPSYAANIWTAGDRIWISFPSPERGARSHSVAFPNNSIGLQAALSTLKAREREPKSHLATLGAPTKRQVEEQLKNDQKYNAMLRAMEVSESDRKEAEQWLKEIGL